MKSELSYYAERVWSHAACRKEVNHEARKKGASVYWIIRKEEWIALRWCHVTEYARGVIRFTRCFVPHPPTTLWPTSVKPYLRNRLEITLAAAELNERKFGRLAEIFTYPERALDWELLQQMTTETNLWSEAAVIAERQARETTKTRVRMH
jgi:hypothetical protein